MVAGNLRVVRASDIQSAQPEARKIPGRGLVGKLAGYAPETVLRLIHGEGGDLRHAPFRAMALMGVRAVPALLDEMVDVRSPSRGVAVRLLRKIVEENPGTDWDNLKGADGGRLKAMLAKAVEDKDPEVSMNAMGALSAAARDPPGENVMVYGLPKKPAGGVLAACAEFLENLPWLRPWYEG